MVPIFTPAPTPEQTEHRPVRVYIGLGTNLGNRWAYLVRALTALEAYVSVDQASPVYETAPWGYTRQPSFLNMVVSGQTALAPHALLRTLKAIETQLGRRPTFRYGPRVIDLDLLFYGSAVINTPELVIPHPQLHQRAFVLVPLHDLAPDLWHPLLRRRVRDLLADLSTTDVRPAVR